MEPLTQVIHGAPREARSHVLSRQARAHPDEAMSTHDREQACSGTFVAERVL